MKIAVVGPGAMGCLFAHALARAGHRLILVDHLPERAELLSRQGITVEEADGRAETIRIPASADPKTVGPAELVILAVKAYSTAEAAAQALPLLGENGWFLSLQNGLGNLEAIAEHVPADRILGGTTAQGANEIAPGRIRHAGTGETVIGAWRGGGGAPAMAELLAGAGFPTSTTDDLAGLLWSKLIVNVGINALTALTDLPNGRLLEFPGTRAVMAAAVAEAAAVAAAAGVRLHYPDPAAKVEAVARATAQNI